MIVGSTLTLYRTELSEKEWRKLFTALTFRDSDQTEMKSYRLLKGGYVRLPRGAWALLPDHVEYEDRRCKPAGRPLSFMKELDYSDAERSFTGQRDALQAMMDEEQGLVIAQPGFGKTQVVLAFAAWAQTRTLVLVHTEDIFNQWVEYAQEAIPDAKIGVIQGQTWNRGDLTIAMVQSVRQEMTRFRREWADKFGAVIVDEGHHAPADTWEQILNCMPAKYRFAVTATESRADGMEPMMRHLIGPVIYRHKFELRVPTKVVPLKSGLKFSYRGRWDWGPLQEAIIKDAGRNQLIADVAGRQLQKNQSVLILSRRIEHLENLHELLEPWSAHGIAILTGKVSKPVRKRLVEKFRSGEIKCLLATQLADEALDVPILSRVFLTYPGKHDGRIIQQLGRALREHRDKTDAVIFDVVDDKVSVLRRQWMERKQTYDKLKIKIEKYSEEKFTTQQAVKRNVAQKIRDRRKSVKMRRQIGR